uniref:Uncharacterized protein n=1 Tax=Plectus sambesii TaxID=2011161 RepID=A0A914VG36_9BILA
MSQPLAALPAAASLDLNGIGQTAQEDGGQRFDPQIVLPYNFEIGNAAAEGNGFFDSFRQSLEQQREIVVIEEQLRQLCKQFAQNNPPEWFENAFFADDNHNNDNSSKKVKKNQK